MKQKAVAGKKKPGRKQPWPVFIYTYGLDGKRSNTETKFFTTQGEARDFAAQVTAGNASMDPKRITLDKAVEIWLTDIKPRISANTWLGYTDKSAKAVRFIGTMALRDITSAILADLYALLEREGGVTQRRDENGKRMARGLSRQSVRHVHTVLGTFFTFAVREKRWLSSNPAELLPKSKKPAPTKRGERKTRALTAKEIVALLNAASAAGEDAYPGLWLTVRVLAETGIRRSEACALAIDALTSDDPGDPAIHVFRKVTKDHTGEPQLTQATKTHCSNRIIPISDELAELLATQKATVQRMALAAGKDYQREPSLLLFPGNAFGDPVIPDTLTSRLRMLMRKAGIGNAPLGTHIMRHSMGSSLVRDPDVDLVTLSRRMGHSKVSTTVDIYAHDDVSAARKAASAAAKLFGKRNET